ncbi:unnamed protein product [Phytophthora lilii]|uniref:HECT-type E3 ubiquitin transferase n=1 Tax=Phytophthora lilii TaxID=2077276 RepID=A0A9W6TYW6_9STRA|nr:unnamed protein product [Phytophthora lilii]
MPLPYDALFEVGNAWVELLHELSSLFADSLTAAPDGINGNRDKERDWELRRLVDLCLQCSTSSSVTVEIAAGFNTVRVLMETLPDMQQYLLSGRLISCHPPKQMRKMMYYEMPRASVTQIIRQGLISARGQLPISSRAKESPFWRSVEGKTDAVVLNEVQLLSKLLQSVPPATYAASGVAVSWTKVSESHSVPVVFPEALNEQLQILVNDQYLRSMCNHLLSFSPSVLRHPLATDRPTPMYPEAATTAEQFGFGDIASASSLSTSLSFTWQKMKSIGKATWARSLFEKAGLRRRREVDDDRHSIGGAVQLPNTSKQARFIALKGVDDLSKASPTIPQRPTALKLSKSTEPFVLDNIKALSCLCGTFLFRWGNDGGKRQSYAMRLLNTLAFYHVEVVESEENTQNVSLVQMLWCVLQDTKNFEDFAKLDSNQLIEEVLQGTPRANKLIQSMPYLVPFPDRVKLFQRLVKADKEIHQNEGCSVYRIRIHRGAILEDGLRKLNSIRTNLKKRINVVFVNSAGREEVGIDAGGLFKEFWLDLSTLAFDLQYGLFLTTHDQLLYPNPNSASNHFSRETDHLTMFQFVGRILGKALYEGIVVQPKFAHFFLSKLLHSFNQLNELPSLDPEIYKSYDGDVEDLGLTHTVVQDVFGEQKEIEIIPGGGNVPVTSRNKTRYIHLVANYYLNTQIREQCAAFRMGLSDLIDPRWLQMFNEPELQVLISGKSGKIDVDDLKANSRYAGGYYALDKRVAWLWQALASFTPSEQAAFLRFTTSCQRAPSLGFASLTPQFCVQKIPIRSDDELLPSSSTCFNTLKLPTYSSYKVLRTKLLTSISSGAGFEMT